ncbi:MAG: M14 family zinc carboxypeptidase [Acidobacteriota bacterium]
MSLWPASLPVDEILAAGSRETPAAEILGQSRQGRPILAHRFDSAAPGASTISLIAGCHADEPVGPELLRRLARWLATAAAAPWRRPLHWRLVPHVNPDGEERNRRWSDHTLPVADWQGRSDRGYDLERYLRDVVREAPGDDLEFGFPRSSTDLEARPEARAVAAFLESAPGRIVFHATLHGMAFADGPWFLLEKSWVERSETLQRNLATRVESMGYRLHDVDRGGEKGFERIAPGFSTRPDSRAMQAHFEARGEPQTAALFRPSSMETVRRIAGDPLTVVSEMPIFLLPPPERWPAKLPHPTGTEGKARFLTALMPRLAAGEEILRPMALRDQMTLQLALIEQGIVCALFQGRPAEGRPAQGRPAEGRPAEGG